MSGTRRTAGAAAVAPAGPFRRGARLLALLALLPLLHAGAALAHKPSDSYLTLEVQGQEAKGRWDIALRDLDSALVLDADGDGRITWGEVRTRHDEIAAYASARLAASAGDQACTVAPAGPQQVDEHTDGAYTVLPLVLRCPAPITQLELRYSLFAELDPQHRGLLNLSAGGRTRTAVLDPAQGAARFELADAAAPGTWATFSSYVREGVWHIWIGFDHILFLLALLLPAVGRFGRGGWQPVAAARPAVLDVLAVVTAFTLAHSITLSLAALGLVELPSRLVESAIAASVVAAALANLRGRGLPPLPRLRVGMAFGFGLLHGFGFASVLADLGLPQGALVLALLGFNLGVELGQLAIVAVFLPLALALRHTGLYRHGVLRAGSMAIALLAALWLVERAFGLEFMPF